MKANKIKNLLSAALEEQEIIYDTQQICDDRLRVIVSNHNLLSVHERHLLLRSPVTRERFNFIKQLQRAEVYQEWQRYNIQPNVLTAAAANAVKIERVEWPCNQYHISIIPLDKQGLEWEIVLKLSEDLYLRSQSGVRLLDKEGTIWVMGKADEKRLIRNYWQHSQMPIERLWQYPPHLEPL